MKNDKTPDDIIKFWREVQINPLHPERKKFSSEFKEHEIQAICQRHINSALKDKENEVDKLEGHTK